MQGTAGSGRRPNPKKQHISAAKQSSLVAAGQVLEGQQQEDEGHALWVRKGGAAGADEVHAMPVPAAQVGVWAPAQGWLSTYGAAAIAACCHRRRC